MSAGPEWERLHDAAVSGGERYYRDPATACVVLTESQHLDRGTCCGCACRHCPWGHIGVTPSYRRADPRRPRWLRTIDPMPPGSPELVSWPGAALPSSDGEQALVLVTAYDAESGDAIEGGAPLDALAPFVERTPWEWLVTPVAPGIDRDQAIARAALVVERRWALVRNPQRRRANSTSRKGTR